MPSISRAFQCVDEVARLGSVRKAAAALHLTPAAVNQQVLNLEAQVGTPMFDRLPRGMRMTMAGEIVIGAIRRSQRDFDNALALVEDMRSLRRGHINVGVSHSTAEHLLPAALDELMRSHPGLTYQIRTGHGEALLQWVANGEVDIAYCLRRSAPAGIQEVRAWPQRLGVVCRSDHPLTTAKSKPIRLQDALEHPLILTSRETELRAMLDQLVIQSPRPLRPVVETSSIPMIRRLVVTSDAVAFLILENVAEDVRQGSLRWLAMREATAPHHSCLYQRTAYSMPVATSVFLDCLSRAIGRASGEAS
jgi:DNA-binding transcriptional LysR family regulator